MRRFQVFLYIVAGMLLLVGILGKAFATSILVGQILWPFIGVAVVVGIFVATYRWLADQIADFFAIEWVKDAIHIILLVLLHSSWLYVWYFLMPNILTSPFNIPYHWALFVANILQLPVGVAIYFLLSPKIPETTNKIWLGYLIISITAGILIFVWILVNFNDGIPDIVILLVVIAVGIALFVGMIALILSLWERTRGTATIITTHLRPVGKFFLKLILIVLAFGAILFVIGYFVDSDYSLDIPEEAPDISEWLWLIILIVIITLIILLIIKIKGWVRWTIIIIILIFLLLFFAGPFAFTDIPALGKCFADYPAEDCGAVLESIMSSNLRTIGGLRGFRNNIAVDYSAFTEDQFLINCETKSAKIALELNIIQRSDCRY